MVWKQSLLTLRCLACGHAEGWSAAEVVENLRNAGFLRRDAEPSDELALELAKGAVEAGKWPPCSACGKRTHGLGQATDEADNAALWGDARHCEQCGAVIPVERLELFPESRLCVGCQKQEETGAGPREQEYCPRCGSIMELRAVRAAGATYRMVCPACRKAL